MSERLAVALQYALPKRLLTQLAGKLAGLEGKATTAVIRWFAKRYGVNMAEAANADPASYASFSQFFTPPAARRRAADRRCGLRLPGRQGDQSVRADRGFDQVFQAKGHFYSTTALVGGDRALAARFENGDFATIYLSPRDYHRIHMPCAGRLTQMIHVPGELFSSESRHRARRARSVRAQRARGVRVRGEFGPFVMVLVGATIVGSMATVWHGVVNPPRRPDIVKRGYAEGRGGAGEGRRDGPLPARLDGGDAVPAGRAALRLRLGAGRPGADGRADGACEVGRALRWCASTRRCTVMVYREWLRRAFPDVILRSRC